MIMENCNLTFDPQYQREMPRDLFNEAKLLKCLGQLLLLYVDQHLADGCKFVHTETQSGFLIGQNPGDGSIGCANLHMWYIEEVGDGKKIRTYVELSTPLNSRDPYPLLFSAYGDEGCVFDTDGKMTPEFHELFGYKNRHDQA